MYLTKSPLGFNLTSATAATASPAPVSATFSGSIVESTAVLPSESWTALSSPPTLVQDLVSPAFTVPAAGAAEAACSPRSASAAAIADVLAAYPLPSPGATRRATTLLYSGMKGDIHDAWRSGDTLVAGVSGAYAETVRLVDGGSMLTTTLENSQLPLPPQPAMQPTARVLWAPTAARLQEADF